MGVHDFILLKNLINIKSTGIFNIGEIDFIGLYRKYTKERSVDRLADNLESYSDENELHCETLSRKALAAVL